MADLKDTQLKAEIDSIMDRVAQIMEKVGSLGLDQEDAATKEERAGKACCSRG
jgi:ribosome assembly protein YihI (activator of Der GTPase)